jgi:hypothetical protein
MHSINVLNWYFTDIGISNASENEEQENLFTICINAEKIPVSLDEYRQKLFHLQRLDPEICKKYFNTKQMQEVNIFI